MDVTDIPTIDAKTDWYLVKTVGILRFLYPSVRLRFPLVPSEFEYFDPIICLGDSLILMPGSSSPRHFENVCAIGHFRVVQSNSEMAYCSYLDFPLGIVQR